MRNRRRKKSTASEKRRRRRRIEEIGKVNEYKRRDERESGESVEEGGDVSGGNRKMLIYIDRPR